MPLDTPLNLPDSPTLGQQYNVGGIVWTWDGTKWTSVAPTSPTYLLTTGGTMTGAITLAGNAAQPLDAVPLQQLNTVPFIVPGTTASRSAQDRGADWVNVKDFGAIGDGVADDTAAVTAALATHKPIFAPYGTYKTTIIQASLTGAIWGGPGQIIDSQSNKRGPILNELSAPPSVLGNWANLLQAFNGDLSRVPFAIEHRIGGSTTLGQPTSGYRFTPEAAAFAEYFYNTSGFNNGPSNQTGRTGAVMHYMSAFQAGQGDLIPYFVNTLVTGTSPGATSFLANPAGTSLSHQIAAANDGVYLQGIGDISINDNSHDVASVGLTINFSRNINTGALGATWMGERFQSKGTQPLDAFWSCSGPATIGLDLASMTIGTAGVAMPAGMRIYGNATNVDTTHFSRYTVLGTEWLGYTAGAGWQLAVGGAQRLTVSSTGLGFNGTAAVAKPTVTGAKGSNAALASLLTALAAYGLIVDSSTA